MKKAALEIFVQSDLYVAGTTEDGEQYIAEKYYIEAEDAKGNRWVHPASFAGCKPEYDHEDQYQWFSDVRTEAKAAAQKIIEALGDEVDLNDWIEARPCYGSEAYAASWQEYAQQDRHL